MAEHSSGDGPGRQLTRQVVLDGSGPEPRQAAQDTEELSGQGIGGPAESDSERAQLSAKTAESPF